MPEIERKFLVREPPPGLESTAPSRSRRATSRRRRTASRSAIRRRGEATTLTVKSGPAMVRVEEEIPIDADRFDALWPLTEGRRSTRSATTSRLTTASSPSSTSTPGALEGLLTAEIEFPSEAAARAFVPAAVAGGGGHGRPAYANQNLAVRPAPGRPPG